LQPASTDGATVLDVQFRPFLWEQRHAWVLSVLRKEQARTVLDIGCGEGSLLATLSQPAQAVFDPTLTNIESESYRDLYLDRIAGLDIVPTELSKAERVTVPSSPAAQPTQNSWIREPIRWSSLEVKLWLGSLDVYNPELNAYEYMVAMEVIEHLPPDILLKFAPMILGRYRPKALLVTTPNYNFSPLFTAPGYTDPNAYPDPTGRTSRFFRHDDHKFEWTEDEFRAWCEGVALDFGYEVEVDGVGRSITEDPYGRISPFASQVAVFRREMERTGLSSQKQKAELIGSSPHTLVACHLHEPHPSGGIFKPTKDIMDRVEEVFHEVDCGALTLRDLWNDWKLPYLCGGALGCLLKAIRNEGDEWEIHQTEESKKYRLAMTVIWKTFVPKPPQIDPEEDRESLLSFAVEADEDEEYQNEHGDWSEQDGGSDVTGNQGDWGWADNSVVAQQSSEWGEGIGWGTKADSTEAHDTKHTF
ncbi:hypothetical protein DACRYDRAFT_48036, partial [Dacryopinax primogenitus]